MMKKHPESFGPKSIAAAFKTARAGSGKAVLFTAPESRLHKRIKHHVVGRLRSYFAVTSLGFENVCLNELLTLPLSDRRLFAVSGGVEFRARLHDCYQANLQLRSATRILLRIDSFHAAGFNKFEQKLYEIPWELYLRDEPLPQIRVTTNHCRLYHTSALAERAINGIARRMAKRDYTEHGGNLSPIDQTVYIRGSDDRFTVSIDSSGAALYKRGIKTHSSVAPLRETIAAAALMLAGYTGEETLLDPMCGSGTFSLEGALLAKRIPPGWFREFAFMNWPSYRPKRWQYLKRQFEKNIINLSRPRIWASDIDANACAHLEECVNTFNLHDAIRVLNTDFFKLVPTEVTDSTGLIAINPPYGRRIGSPTARGNLFAAVCARLKKHYRGWTVILMVPQRRSALHLSSGLRVQPFIHGGLKLVLLTGRIA